MSTRGCIVRMDGDRFEGRYHHWDSYPTALGATLFELFNGHFKRDLESMLKYLIDDHPAGWSTINNADFTMEPGFINRSGDDSKYKHGPECYCHGKRSEKPWVVTDENASESGCEYAYGFTPGSTVMRVMASFCDNGAKMIGMLGSGDPDAKWSMLADVDLLGDEPDWEKMAQ